MEPRTPPEKVVSIEADDDRLVAITNRGRVFVANHDGAEWRELVIELPEAK